MILDQELNGELLAERLRSYITDRARLGEMGAAARRMGRPEAAARIVDECHVLVSG
jgi:UDP-N-acetylglucosamine--N-acetylmuramyl-(pentapeptide) pyrophosphoryl-undecaprenol N-acetylglucosamine transferase